MNKIILVTGVNGFVGHHLCVELSNQGHRVIGTGMDAELLIENKPFVSEYFGNCDLTDSDAVAELPLERVDVVINLAGLAQVGASIGHAEKYARINVAVHTSIADRLVALKKTHVRVIAVSTGTVYDNNQPMPLDEDSKLLVSGGSPYVASKLAMEKALSAYTNKGLSIIVVRPFNHIGPGQLGGFLVPDLTSQILQGNTVSAGDLSTERDYTDVRDVVKAYALLATAPLLNHSLYNICSGKSTSGQAILQELLSAAGKDKEAVKVVIDKTRLRPNDPKKIVGDNSRLRTDTGWAPVIPLKQTIVDVVESAQS